MGKILLKVSNLDHYFGGLHAVKNLDIEVEEGAIKALIGPNGAGKTTIFNLISGDLKPQAGQIFLNGRSIKGLMPFKIAGMGVSRTFQTTRLFLHMTVLENIMVGRHTRSHAGFFPCLLNLPWTWKENMDIEEKAYEILEFLDLSDCAEENAENLSFGRQRLVEIARALATEPELLLLDEPAAGLNIYETNSIAQLITKIRERDITILIVEHDMSLVMGISDNIVVLNNGEKLAEGKPCEIQKNPEVIKIYLGENNA